VITEVPLHGVPPKQRAVLKTRTCIGAQKCVVTAILEPGPYFDNYTHKLLKNSRVNLNSAVDFEDWISQAEAARIRGVSQERIRQLVKDGRLQSLEIGGRKLVKRSEVTIFVPMPEGRPRKKTVLRKQAKTKKQTD
jgi:excisionase family DNA binding protein